MFIKTGKLTLFRKLLLLLFFHFIDIALDLLNNFLIAFFVVNFNILNPFIFIIQMKIFLAIWIKKVILMLCLIVKITLSHHF